MTCSVKTPRPDDKADNLEKFSSNQQAFQAGFLYNCEISFYIPPARNITSMHDAWSSVLSKSCLCAGILLDLLLLKVFRKDTYIMSNSQPILYSYWRSSCSWRVRIALNLKEIPYDIKPISLIKAGGEQHCNEYREVNAMEQVPALQIDGHTLIESLSIMHYLEETRPQRPLLPQDVHKRAKVREICEVVASGIQPLQNLVVLIHVGEEKKKEWAQHWITRGFRAIEKLLSTSAGKFCVGDEITMADCCLVPQVFNARRFHVDLRPYPIILRIDRELESHPAFRAAHPSNQPDCPPEAAK